MKVSFIIPTLGRLNGLKQCLESIKKLNYPQDEIEIIVIEDEPRKGVPARLNEGAAKSTGEYIVYASNDIEFHPDSLFNALQHMNLNKKALCAFNSGKVLPDEGNINEHFIIRRDFVENELNGEIFDPEFNHVGVDNLLWAKASKLNQATRCESAIIKHNHWSLGTGKLDSTYKIGWNKESVEKDRALLKKKLKELEMSKISLCLIVKNEEDVLDRCLNSMKGAYDELVIVDTGSTDRTVEIAKKHGAKVYHFDWIDDFAAARNFSFSKASHDWIMWVDADDVLMPGDAERFRKVVNREMNNENVIGINMPYIYSHESVGSGEIPNFKYHRLRIIKKGKGKWRGRVHEYIEHDTTKTIKTDEIDFHHYRDEGKGTQNTARNMRILKKILEDCTPEERPRYLFYYGKECMYNGKLKEAEKTFLEYIPISNWVPEKHRAMYELAVCCQWQGRIDDAKKYAFDAIRIDENYCDPYVLLGIIAYNEKRWKDVIKWMTAATLLDNPKVLFFDYIPYQTYVPYDYMAIAHWELGNCEEGLKCVEKCLSYKPNDKRYLFNKEEFKKCLS